MLEAKGLRKVYGRTVAVDDLSFTVRGGRVTGFLGPNGAGKSATMRMFLGLDHPESGSALVNGRPFRQLRHPMHEVGAMLDAKAAHPGRSAYGHLLGLACSNGIGRRRVGEVLEITGLGAVARKRIGGFSLGMSQRLGIAAALLGDPQVLLFDEPVNGLDPEGVRWIRDLMKGLAAEGRTVFVSSHLMSEMESTADWLVVIGRGRLIADASVREVTASGSRRVVRVRTPQADQLGVRIRRVGGAVTVDGADTLLVSGLDAALISTLAFECGAELHELSEQRVSLETAFMELTGQSVEYRTGTPDQT
ncbi:ABC transporter ATP-binding protein [Streptomyces sp. GS7]|uniref:ABC transporter ATP-binding protein n=1 Tax=Streptomyces sp. GS7 TaxID=2692234 RepID=UPI001317AC02|nr:ATP-binding cassette domain-containing protein [Streptomyces sp. GS7]QHC27103.1 ATP-binding cassette domain-containing protein [Streptomyces sp. GS7]